MQSSPPERVWKRPSSPDNSQYSIDLAALDQDSRSGASTPLPEQHVDRVHSEDIDGPSDFTVHMEKYFRGGTAGRGTAAKMKSGLESVRETRNEGAQVNGSLLRPRREQADEQSASHHTPSNSPPPDSVFRVGSSLAQRGQDMSEWDPYIDGEESTPAPPAHKQFLQPTVEDYYSELTPARVPSIRKILSATGRVHGANGDVIAEQVEPPSADRPSSDALSPVRSPERSPARSTTHSPKPTTAIERSDMRHFSSQSTEAAFARQLEDLQTKCRQLELLNAALGQAVDKERKLRANEQSAYDKSRADAEQRQRDLRAEKDEAAAQRDEYCADLSKLKTKFEQLERERRRDSELMEEQHNRDVRRISEDARREKAEQDARLRAVERDLELAYRNRDDAEEAERAVRAALEKQHAEVNANDVDDLDRMESDLTQIEDPQDRIHDLEEELQEAKLQLEKVAAAKKAVEAEVDDARAELATLHRKGDEETTRLTADHRRAVAVAEDLQAQLKKLRNQLQTEQTAHKAELARLRAESVPTPTQLPAEDAETKRAELVAKQAELNTAILERDALRDDFEAQQSTLNAAIVERDEAQDALATAQSSLEDAESSLQQAQEDYEAINTAVDSKVSAAIAKREAYWRRIVEASEKERKIMVKALLRQWGREEVGVLDGVHLGGRQAYEYRIVKEKRADAQAGA